MSRDNYLDAELCEDEGCPHHGTPHVCVAREGAEAAGDQTPEPVATPLQAILRDLDWACAQFDGDLADSTPVFVRGARRSTHEFCTLGDLRKAAEAPAAPQRAFAIGARVQKTRGSSWQGRVCGHYSTALTPDGICVESEREPGSVQIYPAKALAPSPPAQSEQEEKP